MKLLQNPAELGAGAPPVALALGVFDGVHLGHQEILRRTVAAARRLGGWAVVGTFDRHPAAVVAPDRVPPAILPVWLRLRYLAAQGVEATWLMTFDAAFSRQTGETFVRRLAAGFTRLAHVCVGQDFHFGWRRSGDVALLERLGATLGFTVESVPPLRVEGQVLSSTLIREGIRQGELETVSRWLGRPYSLGGRVVHGDGLGRRLGFPTANVDIRGLQLPPSGVYAAQIREPDGPWRPAVMNLGVRPTVGTDPELRLEVHVLDGAAELYGRDLEVQPVHRLRAEQRFASLEALRDQIARDVEHAREWWAGASCLGAAAPE